MDAKQFTRALQRLRMNDSEAARFLGIDRRSVRRYKAGELPVPVPIAMLLSSMVRGRLEPNELRKLAGLDPVPFDLPPGRPPSDDDD